MRKGFTLIELLIVIGILSILATATVLVLNPAQILKEARDGQRIVDLRAVRDAVGLYLVRNTSNPTSLSGSANTCILGGTTYPVWRASISSLNSPQQPFINSAGGIEGSASIGNVRAVDGTGWLSINFTQITGNPPLAKLPVDPINSTYGDVNSSLAGDAGLGVNEAYFYAYQCRGLTYEINTNMESDKFKSNGPKDVEKTDGGTNARYTAAFTGQIVADNIYEVGNDPGLDL